MFQIQKNVFWILPRTRINSIQGNPESNLFWFGGWVLNIWICLEFRVSSLEFN
jgi:hypothetical protein